MNGDLKILLQRNIDACQRILDRLTEARADGLTGQTSIDEAEIKLNDAKMALLREDLNLNDK